MVKPRALRSGDRLAVVAPASPFDRQRFEAGVRELRRLAFEPVFDEQVFDRQAYVAGDARTRADAIRAAWLDSSIAGLVAVRGGYGSAHVLPLLSIDEARRGRKVFLGYSDLTSLHVYLTTSCTMVSFHGPMVATNFGRGPEGYDRDSFVRCLMRTEPLGELAPSGLETLNAGEAAGMLLGGTLSQLVASLATPFAFAPPPGYVLFIDEIGEKPYRLDRMLTQLSYSGLLARACAVVFGELPQCDDLSDDSRARAVVADLVRDFPGPVLFGFPSGHTRGPTLTLPFGVRARVVANSRPRLVIEEAAVE